MGSSSMRFEMLSLCITYVLLFVSNISHGQQISSCFKEGGQYTGTAINNPAETLTDSAEDCQKLCQFYGHTCLGFSWVDGQHSWEELRNRCTSWNYIYGMLVDAHYVSGPAYC